MYGNLALNALRTRAHIGNERQVDGFVGEYYGVKKNIIIVLNIWQVYAVHACRVVIVHKKVLSSFHSEDILCVCDDQSDKFSVTSSYAPMTQKTEQLCCVCGYRLMFRLI